MITDQERNVLDLIDQNQQDIIAYTQALIRFKTITPNEGASADGHDYNDLQESITGFVRALGWRPV